MADDVIKEIDDMIKDADGELEDLNLDNLEIGKFTKALTGKLEKLKELATLTINECSLESLAGFPKLPNLIRLEAFNNQFKGTDIKILVDKIPKVKALFLGENQINEFDEITSLSTLKELTHLDLSSTKLSEKDDYRTKVFAMIPSLEVLDDLDKEGNPVEYDDEEGEPDEGEQYEPDGDDDEPEEDEVDYEEDEDDDEFEAKNTKKKKVKKN